jgi:hypothetical protein
MVRRALALAGAVLLSACAGGPAAEPAPPPVYLVFFDFNSAALSAAAKEVVVTAAADAKRLHPARIEIAGFTGREENARTDNALAGQRFKVVEDTLAAEGVDRKLFARLQLMDDIPLPAVGVRRVEIRFVIVPTPRPAPASPSS